MTDDGLFRDKVTNTMHRFVASAAGPAFLNRQLVVGFLIPFFHLPLPDSLNGSKLLCLSSLISWFMDLVSLHFLDLICIYPPFASSILTSTNA